MAVRKVPMPTYDRDTKKILKYYVQAREAIIAELLQLVHSNASSSKVNQQASLLRQVDFILSEMNATVQTTVEEGILASYKQGQAVLSYSVGNYKTLREATEGVAFTQLSRHSVEAIMASTFDDLLSATSLTSKRTKQIIRRVVQEQMKIEMAQASGRRVMNQGIIKELTRKGLSTAVKDEAFVGIVDRIGRKWEMNRYVDMVVRTKYKQARFEGIRVQALEEDVDLALISSHGARDACRYYEGMVISMNGTTKGYPTYEELRQSNQIFHPNCKHTLYPIANLSELSKEERELAEEQLENY